MTVSESSQANLSFANEVASYYRTTITTTLTGQKPRKTDPPRSPKHLATIRDMPPATPSKQQRTCAKCDKPESYKGLCSKHFRETNNLDGPTGGTGRRQLNEDEVREIRRLAAEGVNRWDLSFQYGVTPGTITTITSRRSWKHVD